MYQNKKIFILGMAKSGFAVASLLAKHQNQILITDMKMQEEEAVKELESLGIYLVVTEDPALLLDETFDCVVKNPGIPLDHACIKKAESLNIPVVNEVEVAYSFLPQEVNVIGITGSNGKTTTVTITYEMLKEAGIKVHLGGNIGYPLSSFVDKIQKKDTLLLELSDHQLHDLYEFKTDISVLTNLSKVHLDFHKTYENYKAVKKRIFNHHTNHEVAILNLDNEEVVNLARDISSHKIFFSSTKEADIYMKEGKIYYHEEEVIPLASIRVNGIHNYENIMCAIGVAKEFGVSNEVIKKVLNDFSGVEHRLEYVGRILDREFYNDSKSTNNKSTITALSSFQTPVVLILGGFDRKIGFEELTPYMEHVKHVVCYGQTKEKIEAYCHKINKDCIVLDNLEQAVRVAYNLSDEKDTILFSPACSSQDQFKSFEERGKYFKQYVENLKMEEEKNEDY